jgi:penicillin-binding protein 1A
MASAYATLAADGEHHTPYFVDRVEDRHGKLLFRNTPKADRAVSVDNARVETQVLSQVVVRGTGTAARLPAWGVAGKTGTTDDYTNAWFVGFTPKLSTAVWMGSPDGDVPMRNVGGIRVFGGTYPARIWHDYMANALAGFDPVGFPEPDSYPRGSKFRSISGEEAPEDLETTTTIPGTADPGVLAGPPVVNGPITQYTIPTFPPYTIPQYTIPTISIPVRPTRPTRGG